MQVVLVMFRADGERRSFSIVRDMTVVGRREDCDLRIPLGEVSRKHCRLIKESDSLRLEDLGSSNGTFHNGQRVREATLAAGDTIQVGPVTFMIQIDGVPSDEEMQPAIGGEEGAAAQAPADFPPVDEPAHEGAADGATVDTPAAGGSEADIDFDLPADHAQPAVDAPSAEGEEAIDFDFEDEQSPSNEKPA